MNKKTLLNFTGLLGLLMATLVFSACNQLQVFEKNTSIPHYQWDYNYKPVFDFDITDTQSKYNILIVIRHTDAYHFNNIWLNVGIKSPVDSTATTQRLDLQLGNDAKGWEGTGMDDIWEVRKPATKTPVQFKQPGTYRFSVAQVMRENPLLGIMSVGVRVEKIKMEN